MLGIWGLFISKYESRWCNLCAIIGDGGGIWAPGLVDWPD